MPPPSGDWPLTVPTLFWPWCIDDAIYAYSNGGLGAQSRDISAERMNMVANYSTTPDKTVGAPDV